MSSKELMKLTLLTKRTLRNLTRVTVWFGDGGIYVNIAL